MKVSQFPAFPTSPTTSLLMKRILLATLGLVGLLVGLGFIMPAVAWWRAHGPALMPVALPLLAGTGLAAAGAFTLFRSLVPTRR